MAKKLTDMQRLFCENYLIDLNATAAAQRAGYSAKTATNKASALMKEPQVKAKIDQLLAARSKRVQVAADDVLERLDNIGGVDIAECFDANGALKNIHDIPKELRKCIASIEVLEVEEFNRDTKQMEKIGETKKIKFWDKIKANELIGRNLKMWTDRVEVSGKLTLEALVAGSHEEDVTPILPEPKKK